MIKTTKGNRFPFTLHQRLLWETEKNDNGKRTTAIKEQENNAFQKSNCKTKKRVRKPRFPDTVLSYTSPFLDTLYTRGGRPVRFFDLSDSMLQPVST
jgi:hypothetical protein